MKTTITRKVYLELTSLDKNIPMTWYLEESKAAKDVQTINWASLYNRYSATIEIWKRKESVDRILICVALCDETGTELIELKKFIEEIKPIRKRTHAHSKKVKVFESYEDYEEWDKETSSIAGYTNPPIAIITPSSNQFLLSTECTRWETALKRFENLFKPYNSVVRSWTQAMYKGVMERQTYNMKCPTEIVGNHYQTMITRTADSRWLIYLDISGKSLHEPIEVYHEKI